MENKFHENLSSELIIQIYKLGIFPMAKNRFDSKIYFINPKKERSYLLKIFMYQNLFQDLLKKNLFILKLIQISKK